MSPADFAAWRKRLRMTQAQAAAALGVTLRAVQYYEAGERKISRPIEIACSAIATNRQDAQDE